MREVELRLSEQGARADVLATRSGVMVAAIAVAASLLANQLADGPASSLLVVTLVTLGVSAVSGITVLLMARLADGPAASDLATWAGRNDDGAVMSELFAGKLKTVDANAVALSRLEIVFCLQALSTVVATGLALYFVGKS